MYDVGRMYERGRGTAVNHKQATEWYKRASAAGNDAAKGRLGILYFEGRGVPQDHQRAYHLLTEAAKADNPAAQYQLGLMYEWGTAVRQSKNQAMKWYKKAMKGGDYRAKNKLAQLRTKQEPPVVGSSKLTDTIPTILNNKWQAGTRPVGILPSSISQCKAFKSGLKCQSQQQRSTHNETITYKTESTIANVKQNSFTISYFNTVLNVVPIIRENGPIDDGSTPTTSNIRAGQKSLQHKLECELKNKKQIQCNKDNVRDYSFNAR
ncbi:MAG: sel1 repeat family protein [Halobacteria archaeon]|nr:sel1 repeat family protein [Halobacteria archaeon]